jgi:hypothetical protein
VEGAGGIMTGAKEEVITAYGSPSNGLYSPSSGAQAPVPPLASMTSSEVEILNIIAESNPEFRSIGEDELPFHRKVLLVGL